MTGLLVPILAAVTLAVAITHNDWSKPCFDGECAYELGAHTDSSGVLKLVGSSKSITDVTDAAGWVVLDCDPNLMEQQIRLVCKSSDANAAGCSHLFEHDGPVDKVARLPESCGAGPFARVAKVHVDIDQSMPAHVKRQFVRRGEAPPLVHVLTIDTNFAAVNAETRGQVQLRFLGLNIPDHPMDIDIDWAQAGWFDDAVGWMKGVADKVGQTISKAWEGVKEVAGKVGDAIGKTADNVWHAIKDIPGYIRNAAHFHFDRKLLQSDPTLKGSATLLNLKKETCNAAAHLKVDVSGSGTAHVTVGVVLDGSLFPPTVNQLAAFGTLSADIEGKLNIDAGLSAGYDTGRKQVINAIGIPGFSVPGLFAVGPWIELEAQARAYLDLQMDMEFGLSYHIDDLQMWYPKKIGDPSKKGVETKPAPLKLSVLADVKGYGYIEGHLVPSIKLGFVFGSKKINVKGSPAQAEASIFLEADTYARLSLEAQARVKHETKIGKREEGEEGRRALLTLPEGSGVHPSYAPPYALEAREIAKSGPAGKGQTPSKGKGKGSGKNDISTSDKEAEKIEKSNSVTEVGFAGCVWLDAGIAINGGIQGMILKWKADLTANLWRPDPFNIYTKCWNLGQGLQPPSPWKAKGKELESKFKSNSANCLAKHGKTGKVTTSVVPAKRIA